MSVVLGCLASVFIPVTDFLDPSDMPLSICSDASELLLQIVMPAVETLLQRDEFPYYKTHTSLMMRHLNLEVASLFPHKAVRHVYLGSRLEISEMHLLLGFPE